MTKEIKDAIIDETMMRLVINENITPRTDAKTTTAKSVGKGLITVLIILLLPNVKFGRR
ncbi:hypothetical protein JO972_16740 [Verrucomicrobiaceae bacterium 5K15]|uniref:Uncharacterized protein n=1 Tax=Oceaniferula flava TaxID=2800421 RepID=A0AAE2SGT5_9BACT|nr:hypothetical protein [Oceaniferula flavus]MBK1856614.1 hypothetical protein [Oceaniferula flavus]MBM1137922.1 hypothetical protein [Oceaniferula flavus]